MDNSILYEMCQAVVYSIYKDDVEKVFKKSVELYSTNNKRYKNPMFFPNCIYQSSKLLGIPIDELKLASITRKY